MTRVTAVVLVVAVAAAACTSKRREPAGYRRAPEKAGSAVYPTTWTTPTSLPSSPGLRFVAQGTPAPGCPTPVYAVRQAPGQTGTLEEAVVLFNQLEALRRPGRRVVEERKVAVRKADAAVLVVAEAPAEPGSERVVRTFDLLGLTEEGEAFHVTASGCDGDLPRDLLDQAVLSFRPR